MKHLYELTGEYRFLESDLEEEGDAFGVLENALKEVKDNIEEKSENIAKFILSLNAEVDTIKAEETRLLTRRKSIENRTMWLKDYLLRELEAVNIDKIKRELITISVRDNPPSVKVIDEELIPKEYRRIIPETWEVEKRAIIDQFKSTGEIVDGVEIITDRKSLQIK